MPNASLPLKAAIVLLALFLVACGARRADFTETASVEELYASAKQSMDRGNMGRAVQHYRRLIARFPFGEYTEQAQIELAYSQYKLRQPDDALSTINRFIRTYPTHEKIVYAYYLRGLINFDREFSFLERFIGRDPTHRDLTHMRQAFTDFNELIQRYPDSIYAADARQRMIYLRNNLAQSEIHVAAYYLKRRAWVAAATRARFVVENYPQAPQNGDALAVLAFSYGRLGEEKLASDAERILRMNFPDHPYLSGGWPHEKSVWRRLLLFG
ncbi:MAG TPA: outer membrane protein assembly factor BamD [Xanthomonadaceae bacterium]|nr:outer membrane protein assembly factor BamD [Xanthomonadaceae bacterium]